MLIAALSPIAKKYKQIEYSFLDEWVKKKNGSIHTMEYYSASKKKEILSHVTERMSLEDLMQSDTRQA